MSNIDISFYKSLLIRTAFIGGFTSLISPSIVQAESNYLSPIINYLLTSEIESDQSIDFGLDPNKQPWENFDLSDWALDAPNADPDDGFSARTDDSDFIEGQLFEGSEPFLFTASDGGMVFKSTMNGVTTSGTSFVRSELREMLRAGADGVSTQGVNENNWVLGYQPTALEFGEHTSSAQDQTPTEVGGRNGKLTATLRVNQVTTTGRNSRVGRVIIGQIHADDDEPMRLYYRKLPTNEKGSVYFVHEIRGGDDLDNFDIVGSSANPPSNHPHTGDPISDTSDGIALDELFSYEIENIGSVINVIVRRGDKDGEIIGQQSLDMATTQSTDDDGNLVTGSGYDLADEWMYFKAGAYSQNNTDVATDRTDGRGADSEDYDQVTFYRLENTHD